MLGEVQGKFKTNWFNLRFFFFFFKGEERSPKNRKIFGKSLETSKIVKKLIKKSYCVSKSRNTIYKCIKEKYV